MGAINEFKDLPDRYKRYARELSELMGRYRITGLSTLVKSYRNDDDFKHEWKTIWLAIAQTDGGKVSLSTVGLIMGASLGGVGIAAAGGAVGVPLALVLGIGGLLGGSSFDSRDVFGNSKHVLLKIPKELHRAIELEAKLSHATVSEVIAEKLTMAYKSEI